jgi:hypothetical protein
MRILLILVLMSLFCSPSCAANEEFPQQVQGFWVADTRETCDLLKTKSPSELRRDQRWLKLTATDVLGTTQARFLKERKIPVQIRGSDPIKMQFEIQIADSFGLIGVLSFVEGHRGLSLRETIVGARASRRYFKC